MRLLSKDIYTPNRATKINLIPLGDLHVGSRNCAEKKIEELVKWIKEQPNTYVIGMGDYIEAICPSDKRWNVESIMEDNDGPKKKKNNQLNNLLYRQIDRVTEMLLPIRHKIIGLLTGNHEETAKLRYHVDPIEILCSEKYLNVENLTYSALIRLVMRRRDSKTSGRSVRIYAHHGFGGGQTIGGKLNKVNKLAMNFNADIYLMGHVHDKYVFASEQQDITEGGEPRLIAKKKVFALTGSFFETYIDGYSSYAEKMAYSPIPTGVIKLVIIPYKQAMVDGKQIDMPVDIHPSV